MKIKAKLAEVLNLLIKEEDSLLKRYNLEKKEIVNIQKSLVEGNWRFC